MSKALLVIDMLNDFCTPQGVLARDGEGKVYAEPIIPFVARKVREALQEGWRVIFICDSHDENDIEFNRFPKHCVTGSEGAQVIEELPAPEEYRGQVHYVTKQRYSGFYNTRLEELLTGVEEVHVVGVCTNICVLYTVEELCNRDIKTVVYRDGVASFDPEAHRFALVQMESVLGAEIR
ncbi:MAG TPA: cysteine hydrolase [Clostridia bacterium]|nr:cysteine hydrolase [Clostridia bacterium]